MHLVVVGGSDAGISAGLRARELSPATDVTVVVADAYPNFSVCGLPFYVSGETGDWHQLAHHGLAELEEAGLNLLLNHSAFAIDAREREVRIEDLDGTPRLLRYDQLVVATGAKPIRPPIAGANEPGVYVLHTMDDSFLVHDRVAAGEVEDAVIVGGGYIGLEMADALTHRGVRVTLVGRAASVLPTVDPPFGRAVGEELQRHGIAVHAGVAAEAIERDSDRRLAVRASGGLTLKADLVLMAAGVRPNTELAVSAGVELGAQGAIRVDRRMATSGPNVWAAGDCVETWHRVLQAPTYLPLGTTAHKQGRVAGENAVGGQREFEGSVGTQVVKVFDLAIARSGLRDSEARQAGFDPITVETETWDHKAYYPGGCRIRLRVTGDRQTGQLLGAQILGPLQAGVAKRIDVYATALFSAMTVDAINDLDLSYTPPFGSPWDAVQVAAQTWSQALVVNAA